MAVRGGEVLAGHPHLVGGVGQTDHLPVILAGRGRDVVGDDEGIAAVEQLDLERPRVALHLPGDWVGAAGSPSYRLISGK